MLFTYLMAEAAFCFVGLQYVPLRLQADLPDDIRVFAQSTKNRVIPNAPILLLGDSYAQGFGDWLLETDSDRNGPFNSGHMIHDLTGRDVITLGRSGAGSAEGIAEIPSVAFARTSKAWYLRLPRPSVAAVYFYEGNDLNDNIAFLNRRLPPEERDAAHIDAAISTHSVASGERIGSGLDFPLLRFVYGLSRRLILELSGRGPPRRFEPPFVSGQSNLVRISSKTVRLPAHLQSPALELTNEEINQATLVFQRSLAFLIKQFPDVPILVVYIPSPLSSYEIIGPDVSIQTYLADRHSRYLKERVTDSSDTMCRLIRAASVGQGTGFLDVRDAIRVTGSNELVHGPRDFKHFNRAGMIALGRAIAEQVGQPLAAGECSTSRD